MRIAFLPAAIALVVAACTPPAAPPNEHAVEQSAVVINAPAANARVTSPLRVEGTAPGDWFFEAQFPAQIRGADGQVLAEAPARAQSDWMTEAPVPYVAEFQFTVTEETPATLVLQEDMPGDEANPRETTVQIVLLPTLN